MGLQSSEFVNALEELSEGKLSGDSAKYVASIVSTDLLSDESAAGEVFECIGSFLWDAGLITSDAEGHNFCHKLILKITGVAPTEAEDLKGKRLEKPVVLRDIIRVKVERRKIQIAEDGEETEPVQEETAGSGFDDPFLGLEKVSANFNMFIPIDESMKLAKALAKKREKQLRMMKQWEKSKVPLPPPKRRHGDAQMRKLTDIVIPMFSVSVAGRELLKDAQMKVVLGHRYGLIGRNGIGKTTFISALVRGEIHGVDPGVNIGCVEQEFERGDNITPLDCVLAVDEERSSLLAEESRLSKEEQTEEQGKRLTWVYARLAEIDADKAEAKAAQILSGLGLSLDMYRVKKVKELSGGWRMRVMLARVLFADPDILCLDEPTNHLDLHAVAWLTQYLKASNKTCIIVSHARSFLNDVCTDIMEFKDRQLKYYPGDYDTYEQAKADKELQQQRELQGQEAKKVHMQKFIDRFRYNANRAALVQSRLKALAKLPMLESVTEDPTLCFKFADPTDLPTPMLVMQGASFSYDPKQVVNKDYLLRDVDFSADLNTRAAICGVNGSGKSTFLKLLMGVVDPSEGLVSKHNKLKIGFFAQHHVDGLDLTKNAVQQLQARYPDAKLTDEAARNFLGKFGISGMMALEPLFILSGGQKSRVAIAVMAFDEPHILVLDEPTNHLDLDAVQALIAALNTFEGGVVLVSHDTHLLACVIEDVYHVDTVSHTVTKFKGDFEEYKSQLLRKRPPPAQ